MNDYCILLHLFHHEENYSFVLSNGMAEWALGPEGTLVILKKLPKGAGKVPFWSLC